MVFVNKYDAFRKMLHEKRYAEKKDAESDGKMDKEKGCIFRYTLECFIEFVISSF